MKEKSIRPCCQAHYGLEGTRYECMTSRQNPEINLMFMPNKDKPLFTVVVDCECVCHTKGESTMATKNKVAKSTKKAVEDKKKTPATKNKVAKGKKKTPATKNKVAKGKKKTPATNEKKQAYLDGKIKVLAKENPRLPGTARHAMFKLLNKHSTVGAYLKAGGSNKALKRDMELGHISFKAYESY